jgi:hypothetical protein
MYKFKKVSLSVVTKGMKSHGVTMFLSIFIKEQKLKLNFQTRLDCMLNVVEEG